MDVGIRKCVNKENCNLVIGLQRRFAKNILVELEQNPFSL